MVDVQFGGGTYMYLIHQQLVQDIGAYPTALNWRSIFIVRMEYFQIQCNHIILTKLNRLIKSLIIQTLSNLFYKLFLND